MTIEISTMRSLDVSTPVVSRSKNIIGRLSFKFIAIVLGPVARDSTPKPQETFLLEGVRCGGLSQIANPQFTWRK